MGGEGLADSSGDKAGREGSDQPSQRKGYLNAWRKTTTSKVKRTGETGCGKRKCLRQK